MPEAAAVGDGYQVKIIGSQEGQQTVNVLHFTCVGATADVELHLIQVLLSCFVDNVLPVLSSAWRLEKVLWKRVSPTLGPEIESIPTGTTTGGGSPDALPTYCSAVMSLRSIRPGKSGRGRFYLAGIPEDATDGSSFDPEGAFFAALIAFALCLVTNFVHPDPIGSDEFDLTVYSRTVGGAAYPFGATGFSSVTGVFPQRELGTTRSRKLGRGV